MASAIKQLEYQQELLAYKICIKNIMRRNALTGKCEMKMDEKNDDVIRCFEYMRSEIPELKVLISNATPEAMIYMWAVGEDFGEDVISTYVFYLIWMWFINAYIRDKNMFNDKLFISINTLKKMKPQETQGLSDEQCKEYILFYRMIHQESYNDIFMRSIREHMATVGRLESQIEKIKKHG